MIWVCRVRESDLSFVASCIHFLPFLLYFFFLCAEELNYSSSSLSFSYSFKKDSHLASIEMTELNNTHLCPWEVLSSRHALAVEGNFICCPFPAMYVLYSRTLSKKSRVFVLEIDSAFFFFFHKENQLFGGVYYLNYASPLSKFVFVHLDWNLGQVLSMTFFLSVFS